jgi:hypothetical protein
MGKGRIEPVGIGVDAQATPTGTAIATAMMEVAAMHLTLVRSAPVLVLERGYISRCLSSGTQFKLVRAG